MKKQIFILAAAMLLLVTTSCKKEGEGIFNPEMRISTIYTQSILYQNDNFVDGIERYVSEQWDWQGDKLQSITYFYPVKQLGKDSTITDTSFVQYFSYDKDGRLVRADLKGAVNMYADYVYESNLLKYITIYENGEECISYTFNHSGRTITTIDVRVITYLSYKSLPILNRTNPLRFILTDDVAAQIIEATCRSASMMTKNGTKNIVTAVLNLTWDNGNLIRITGSLQNSISMQMDFAYDSKNNPYYKMNELSCTLTDIYLPVVALSKNNMVEYTIQQTHMGVTETATTQYEYTYNNLDYPLRQTVEETWQKADLVWDEEAQDYYEGSTTSVYRQEDIRFFEYE